MARPRIRGYNARNFDLYPSETILGWRVIRKVAYAEGEEKVAQGLWREVYDEQNNHVGFQIVGARSDLDILASRPTSSGIVKHEMQANAFAVFQDGRSKTAGMSEDQRLTRKHYETGLALPPEDAIERIQAKVRVWPDTQPNRKDILRVWPKK